MLNSLQPLALKHDDNVKSLLHAVRAAVPAVPAVPGPHVVSPLRRYTPAKGTHRQTSHQLTLAHRGKFINAKTDIIDIRASVDKKLSTDTLNPAVPKRRCSISGSSPPPRAARQPNRRSIAPACRQACDPPRPRASLISSCADVRSSG
jgi:hypothetical protein